jgi:hypothetical protein
MLMQEFVSRFSSKDEGSFLFEIMRRVGRLDPLALASDPPYVWSEWSPGDPTTGGGPSLGVARA